MFKESFPKLILKNIEVIVLLLWLLCVGIIFRVIPERQTAGLIAGTGFLVIPLWLTSRLLKQPHTIVRQIRLAAVLFFLLVSSLPIIGLRLFNYGIDFNELSLFGVLTGRQIHKISNFTYLLMVLSYVAVKPRKTNESTKQE